MYLAFRIVLIENFCKNQCTFLRRIVFKLYVIVLVTERCKWRVNSLRRHRYCSRPVRNDNNNTNIVGKVEHIYYLIILYCFLSYYKKTAQHIDWEICIYLLLGANEDCRGLIRSLQCEINFALTNLCELKLSCKYTFRVFLHQLQPTNDEEYVYSLLRIFYMNKFRELLNKHLIHLRN